jgi:HSP20 family protein
MPESTGEKMDYIKIRFGKKIICSQYESGKNKESMFQHINPLFCLTEQTWKPHMDMYESPNEIIIQATMAGVEKDNILIEISDKAIKVSGERFRPISEKVSFKLAEIQYGHFERVLFMPCSIDTETVSASYNNGFLQIKLAKVAENNQ